MSQEPITGEYTPWVVQDPASRRWLTCNGKEHERYRIVDGPAASHEQGQRRAKALNNSPCGSDLRAFELELVRSLKEQFPHPTPAQADYLKKSIAAEIEKRGRQWLHRFHREMETSVNVPEQGAEL